MMSMYKDGAIYVIKVIVRTTAIMAIFVAVGATIELRHLNSLPEYQDASARYLARCPVQVEYSENGTRIPVRETRPGC